MQLKGSFEASSLPSLLQMLVNDAKTGELRLTEGEKEVVIFLKQGSVIYAKGSQMEMRLGSLLRSKGVISAQQLQECLVKAKESKQPVGRVLVAGGYITQEVLRKVINKQAEDVIYNLFLWDRGNFDYNDVEKVPDGIVETRLDIMGIILEATRRIDEMSVLRKHIENEQVIFKISDKFGDKEKLKFNAIEWRFLSLIDGTRTIRQLINESGYEDFAVYKVLHSLLSFKLIERVDEGQEGAGSALGVLVLFYNDIVNEIVKGLEMEVASWPYIVMDPADGPAISRKPEALRELRKEHDKRWIRLYVERAKPGAQSAKTDLFHMYHPDVPAEVFSHAAQEVLKEFSDQAKAKEFLVRAFNAFVENLLSRLHEAVGVTSAQDLLKEMMRALRYMAKYQKNLADKGDILREVENVVRKVDRSLWNEKGGKADGSKVFAVGVLPPAEALPEEAAPLQAQIVEVEEASPDAPRDGHAPGGYAIDEPSALGDDELSDLSAEDLSDLGGDELPTLDDVELTEVDDVDILDDSLPDEAAGAPGAGGGGFAGGDLSGEDDPIAAAAAELEQLAGMDLMGDGEGGDADSLGSLSDLDEDGVLDAAADFDALPDLDSEEEFPDGEAPLKKGRPLTGIEVPGLEEALARESKRPAGKVMGKK